MVMHSSSNPLITNSPFGGPQYADSIRFHILHKGFWGRQRFPQHETCWPRWKQRKLRPDMFTTNNELCGEVSYVSASSMQEVVMHNSVLLGCVQNVARPTSGKRIAIRCHGMTRFIPKRNSHWMLKSSHCQNAKNLQRYRTCTIFWTVFFCRKIIATVSIKIACVSLSQTQKCLAPSCRVPRVFSPNPPTKASLPAPGLGFGLDHYVMICFVVSAKVAKRCYKRGLGPKKG